MSLRAAKGVKCYTHSMFVAIILAAVLVATLLFTAPAKAQDVESKEITVQAEEETIELPEEQEPIKQARGTTAGIRKNESTLASTQATSDEPEQEVQGGKQQAQVDANEEDDTQTTARARDPLAGETAELANRASNGGEDVDLITIEAADCTVQPNATVTVENNGQQTTINNSENDITANDERIVITGPGGDDIVASNIENLGTGAGSVVNSTGITCGRDSGGNGGTGQGGGNEQFFPGSNAECRNANVVARVTGTGPKQSAPFRVSGERFRISIRNVSTSSDPDLSGVSVFVNEENGDPVTTFSQEGPGVDSSIVNAGPGSFFIETNPANSQYAIVVQDCAGVDSSSNDDDDDIVNDPGGNLPNTGGIPIPVLAGWAALLLVGTALVGAAVGRRR